VASARLLAPIHRVAKSGYSRKASFRHQKFSEVAGRWVYALCPKSCREERAVHRRLLDGVVRGTKTVMTRAELGGTLYLVAVIGMLLTSRGKESGS
jgi:hypothetical protein